MKKTKIFSTIVCMGLILSTFVTAYAQVGELSEDGDAIYEVEELKETEEYTYQNALNFFQELNVSEEKLDELKLACKEDNKVSQNTFSKFYSDQENDELSIYESSIISLAKQAQAYSFTDGQINDYLDGLIKSTPAFLSQELTSSNVTNRTTGDHMRGFAEDGAGYEVQSLPGYNEATAYGTVGKAKLNKSSGQAAYMFFTVSRYVNGVYKNNDYGLAYSGGKFYGVASGPITKWKTKDLSYSLVAGQRVYMHISLVNGEVRLRILDGNKFSKVFLDCKFAGGGYFPNNGSGVIMNRQITLCDTDKKLGSGLYFENASFENSYLYNPNGYSKFSSSNTTKSRRGRFKADWTQYENVTVHSNTEWDSENISINF